MGDPLNAAAVNNTRPVSWEKFDEISMSSPNDETKEETAAEMTDDKILREDSMDVEIEDGRNSAAAEARLDIEDNERAVVTPLPTNEIIADVSKLGQAPVVSVSQDLGQDYALDVITKDNVILTPGGIELVNGRRLATINPENNHCAWIIPPRYEPTCMPAILAADGIAVPGGDYITAMELLTNDYRFRSFSTLYSRIIAIWMTLSIVILLVVLFTNTQGGLPVMIFCFIWIFMLFAGIFGCAIIRKQIRIGLRHCVHSANKVLIKHNIIAGIEDKGQLSCHKVVIHFLWYKTSDCLPDLERLIRIESSGGAVVFGGEAHSAPGKEMTKTEITEKAMQLVLKYSQGYVKDTVRHRLIFPSKPAHGVSDYSPKHVRRQLCICQYVEKKHFHRTPKKWYSFFV